MSLTSMEVAEGALRATNTEQEEEEVAAGMTVGVSPPELAGTPTSPPIYLMLKTEEEEEERG